MMFDETNQTELPEQLFDEPEEQTSLQDPFDESPEDVIPGEEDADALFDLDRTERDNTFQAKPAGDEQTVSIKYNGKIMDIPMSEAVTLAQKGMNYDHVVAERDTKYAREVQLLDRMAEECGMSREDYLCSFDNGSDQVYSASGPQAGVADSQTASWKVFFNAYPGISVDMLPDEVFDAVSAGMSPIEAYQHLQLTETREALAIARQSADVRARAVGSATGDAQETKNDLFLEGFLED